MELVLSMSDSREEASTSAAERVSYARPEYLLKVGSRLVPVTRASLERLGILRPLSPS
jgi:hypothetical protein